MTQLWCNGQWLDPLEFSVAHTDRGLLLGLGLFETLLAIDGQPVFPDRHLDRLLAGCGRLGWAFPSTDIKEVLPELLRRNELCEGRARIRMAITAGSGRVRELALGEDHLVWVTAVPIAEAPESTSANLSPWRRNEHSPLAGLKCASYAENILALEHADRLGFEETFFLNTAGDLCEAATSNVFLVKNGTVRTPSLASGCLPGITRAVVIELSRKLGIPCEEGGLREEDLRQADEIFLTSSVRGVMAVSRFEGRTLAPGPVTSALNKAWNAAIAGKNLT